MSETTLSKAAMAVARGLCTATDHNDGLYPEGYDERPCTCEPIAAALDAFAADMNDGDRTFKRLAQAERERDNLRERNRMLVEALRDLYEYTQKYEAIVSVTVFSRSYLRDAVERLDTKAVGDKVRAALAADAKAGRRWR